MSFTNKAGEQTLRDPQTTPAAFAATLFTNIDKGKWWGAGTAPQPGSATCWVRRPDGSATAGYVVSYAVGGNVKIYYLGIDPSGVTGAKIDHEEVWSGDTSRLNWDPERYKDDVKLNLMAVMQKEQALGAAAPMLNLADGPSEVEGAASSLLGAAAADEEAKGAGNLLDMSKASGGSAQGGGSRSRRKKRRTKRRTKHRTKRRRTGRGHKKTGRRQKRTRRTRRRY